MLKSHKETRKQGNSENLPTDVIIKERVRRYLSEGKFKEAEEYYLKSLKFREEAYGKNHSTILPLLDEIADFYRRILEYDKADLYAKRSKTLRNQIAAGIEAVEVAEEAPQEAVVEERASDAESITEKPALEVEEAKLRESLAHEETLAEAKENLTPSIGEPVREEKPSIGEPGDKIQEISIEEIETVEVEESVEELIETEETDFIEKEIDIEKEAEPAPAMEDASHSEPTLKEEEGEDKFKYGMSGLQLGRQFTTPQTVPASAKAEEIREEKVIAEPKKVAATPIPERKPAKPEKVAKAPEKVTEEVALKTQPVKETPISMTASVSEAKQKKTIPEKKPASVQTREKPKMYERKSEIPFHSGIHRTPVSGEKFDVASIRSKLDLSTEKIALILGIPHTVFQDYEKGEKEAPVYIQEQLKALETGRRPAPYRLGQVARILDHDGGSCDRIPEWAVHPQSMLDHFGDLKPDTNSTLDRRLIQFLNEIPEFFLEIPDSQDSTGELPFPHQVLFWLGYYSYEASRPEEISNQARISPDRVNISVVREGLNLTESAFATKLGIPVSDFQTYEKGEHPAPRYLLELIQAFAEERRPAPFHLGKIARILDLDGASSGEIADWASHPIKMLERLDGLKPETNSVRDQTLIDCFEKISEFIEEIPLNTDYPATLPRQQQAEFWLGYYSEDVAYLEEGGK